MDGQSNKKCFVRDISKFQFDYQIFSRLVNQILEKNILLGNSMILPFFQIMLEWLTVDMCVCTICHNVPSLINYFAFVRRDMCVGGVHFEVDKHKCVYFQYKIYLRGRKFSNLSYKSLLEYLSRKRVKSSWTKCTHHKSEKEKPLIPLWRTKADGALNYDEKKVKIYCAPR